MQNRTLLPILVLLAGAAAQGHAVAQVTVNPQALEPLQPGATSPTPSTTPAKPADKPAAKPAPPARRSSSRSAPQAAPDAATPTKPGTAAAPSTDSRKLTVPTTPPPALSIPPPIVVPARPIPPPAPVVVVPEAAGNATPVPGGLRIAFAADGADLNPDMAAAVRTLVHSLPPFDTTTFAVTAYAAGSGEDPSTPRRLSLTRALAVRGVLLAEGVASTRIYVKALGAASPTVNDGPADRVDLIATTPPPPAPAAPAPSTPAPPPAPVPATPAAKPSQAKPPSAR